MHAEYTAGIEINGSHSYDDFGLHIRSRKIGLPEKKMLLGTVPFMNGLYDFSAIAGEAAWGQREIEYGFDLVSASAVELEEVKAELIDWLSNVHDVDIYDDVLPDTHFTGSYASAEFSDDESGLGSTLTVAFTCQPFRKANTVTTVALPVGETTVTVPGMTVTGTVDCEDGCVLTLRDTSQSIAGTGVALLIPLKRGDNVITVAEAAAVLHYYAEVI